MQPAQNAVRIRRKPMRTRYISPPLHSMGYIVILGQKNKPHKGLEKEYNRTEHALAAGFARNEMTLDCSFLSDSRNFFVQSRVISVHSYYLTSLVTSISTD